MSHLIIWLVLAIFLWGASLVLMGADAGPFGLPSGIYIGIGAVIVGILTFFGLQRKQNAATDVAGKLKVLLLTKEDVDRAVENVLGKLGVPALLADKIGDIVAMVLLGLPDWIAEKVSSLSPAQGVSLRLGESTLTKDEPVLQAIRGEMVRQATDAHPAVLVELLPGLPQAAYTVRDNRVLVANRIAVDPRVTSVIQEKISRIVGASTVKQHSLSRTKMA